MSNAIWLGVDGTNWIHQLWHAMAGSKPGQVVDAAVRRLTAIVEWIEDEERKPRSSCPQILVCFDRRSFRSELSPQYKANRGPKLDGLVETLALAERVISRDYGTVAAVDGYEADDLLATFAAYGVQSNVQVILASPDKDLRQCLVAGAVSILPAPKVERGRLAKPDWLTADGLQRATGLRPDQWPDYQALVGERGDNVEGCPTIGPKTAATMLAQCGSLVEMLRNPWAAPCTSRQRNALFAWRPKAELALRLVTLRRDVEAVWDYLR